MHNRYSFLFKCVYSLAGLFLILILSFCTSSPIEYTDLFEPVELSSVEKDYITVKVLAKAEEWRESGVIIKKGNVYKITTTGEWRSGNACGWTGGDGIGVYTAFCWDNEDRKMIKGWGFSTLIGKIGTSAPFIVGNEYEFEAQYDGILYFRINDAEGWCYDNEGYLNVTTRIVSVSTSNLTADNQEVDDSEPKLDKSEYTTVAGQNWAVVIGISDYNDSRIPDLRYASADAEYFYDWLISPEGGRYAPSRVKLLLDEDATCANIKDALFNWLGQTIEEDSVIIYFSGHGSPQSPSNPGNLFLLPTDSQYENIAISAFPMWDLETALERFIRANKVIIISDACHSGGVGEGFDAGFRSDKGLEVNPINSGLQDLSTVGDGICVISSSDDNQFSVEGEQWGGGHGVFTYYLLEALNGEADYNNDTVVTLGELIPYLSEQVRRATSNSQSPTVAGKFDPALSIGNY